MLVILCACSMRISLAWFSEMFNTEMNDLRIAASVSTHVSALPLATQKQSIIQQRDLFNLPGDVISADSTYHVDSCWFHQFLTNGVWLLLFCDPPSHKMGSLKVACWTE